MSIAPLGPIVNTFALAPSDDPDRDRRMRDAASDPQLHAFHEAILALRENAARTDLSATDQQRRQMYLEYRVAVAEANYLRARLLAWHPWLLDGDPLTQLHGVALDLDVLADTLELGEADMLAADVREHARAVRAAVGGAMGPLPHGGGS